MGERDPGGGKEKTFCLGMVFLIGVLLPRGFMFFFFFFLEVLWYLSRVLKRFGVLLGFSRVFHVFFCFLNVVSSVLLFFPRVAHSFCNFGQRKRYTTSLFEPLLLPQETVNSKHSMAWGAQKVTQQT